MRLQFILSLLTLGLCDIINQKVIRNVDLTRPFVRESVIVDFLSTDDSVATEYVLLVPTKDFASCGEVRAFDALNNQLKVTPSETTLSFDDVEFTQLVVDLDHEVDSENVFQVVFTLSYIDSVYPSPPTGGQASSQELEYDTLKHYVSVYDTKNEASRFKLLSPNTAVDAITGEKAPAATRNGIFSYDAANLAKHHVEKLKLHYDHPMSTPRIEKLNRTIWVSHWGGSVSFDESYDLYNSGTKLLGEFSRAYSGAVPGTLNFAAVRELNFRLPESHREEYVVDLAGNVSTSNLRKSTLKVQPRYPVMGGWLYNFTLGWASDLGKFVKHAGKNQYILSVPLVYGPEHVGYRQVVNNVVLPEGATNIEVGVTSSIDYEVSQQFKTYSYLDLAGRPTLTVSAQNLVSDFQDSKLVVLYNYSLINALKKPLIYTAYIFGFLACAKSVFSYVV